MLDSRDRVRFTTQVDREYGGRITLTFVDMSPEEGREITALVSKLNSWRERNKSARPISLAGGEAKPYREPEPEPQTKPSSGNRFSGLDLK